MRKIKSKEELSELLRKNQDFVISFRDAGLEIIVGRKERYFEGNFDLFFKENNVEIRSVNLNEKFPGRLKWDYLAFQDRYPQDLPGHHGILVLGCEKTYLTVCYKDNTEVFI